MSKFLIVHAYGSEIMINISQIKYLSSRSSAKGSIVYFSDGKWLELTETYDQVKRMIQDDS